MAEPFNLRSQATQVALRVLPTHAEREALAYVERQWKACEFPDDPPCPHTKTVRPTVMTVAIREGKLVAWSMSVNVLGHGEVRILRCEGRYIYSETGMGDTYAHLALKKAGVTKTLKWYNGKWMNVEY